MSADGNTTDDRLAGKRLEDLESEIAQGLSSRDAIAPALLEIHDRKLYREKYGSFRAHLAHRWPFKRAWAYQLLRFAHIKKLSTTVDSRSPENERQARRLDAAGNMRATQEKNRIERAMDYLTKRFESLPCSERAEFIQVIRALLVDLEKEWHDQEHAVATVNPEPQPPDLPKSAQPGVPPVGMIPTEGQELGSRR
jgi:hypothetical protein